MYIKSKKGKAGHNYTSQEGFPVELSLFYTMLRNSKALISLWVTTQRSQWSLVASFQFSEIVFIIFFDGPFTLDEKSCSLVLRGDNY